jgi:DNA-binding response OmpR family regulator
MATRKLLVVDDEHDICDFVKNFFQERGYNVVTALNGDSAIAYVKQERPDLVLLDVKMKGMDGIATLRHLKSIDRNMNVIMVTALDDQDKMDEAARLGASDYITKPLVLDDLEQAVERKFKI